jgi:hypothetical protein
MCRITPLERRFIPAASNHGVSQMDTKVKETSAMINSSLGSKSNGLRVLICSENVPPQVNGIARRVGMYADGLRNLGCDVGKSTNNNKRTGVALNLTNPSH